MTDTQHDHTTRPARTDEVSELVVTLLETPPTRLTACRGWTAHELVAHLAAGAAEEASLIEAALACGPVPATRAHDERERPFRELDDDALRERLAESSARLTSAIGRLGDGVVPFTGRPMTANAFKLHSRMECAVHRWDLVGRDDIGWQMLGQADLTRHAIGVLGSMGTLPEAPGRRLRGALEADTEVVLRSPAHDDVVVRTGSAAEDGIIELRPTDGGDLADVELDAAARLLLLWGRREPSATIDVHSEPARQVVDALLWGRG